MKHNETPKKSLGQHWLHDSFSLQAMCDAAGVEQGDTVLEIGPGLGTLTSELLDRGARVVAVELDERLSADLIQKFEGKPVQIHQESILTFDLTQLPPQYKVAANIPYYLTSNLLRLMSETPNPPSQAALLVQKEVAERVASHPGGMSLISVAVQFYNDVSLGEEVPAYLFTPPPKVDSQILILKRRPKPLFDVDEKQFFQVVKAGFSARRKTLLNALSGGLRLAKSEVRTWLEAAEIQPERRPQELSLQEWHRLYQTRVT